MATHIIDDMDDRQDLPSYGQAPVFQKALTILNEILLTVYLAADRTAQRHQKDHRRLTLVSVVCGTLAVLFAIVQLVFVQFAGVTKEQVHWVKMGELSAVILGVVSVVVGLWAAKQTSWLRERHKAERYRLLKFRSLTYEALWSEEGGGLEAWRRKVERELDEIRVAGRPAVEAWADQDKPSDPPSTLSRCAFSTEELKALVRYFVEKRVAFQSDYFLKRSLQYRKRDHILRHLAPACFFVSVGCALVHSLLDFLYGGTGAAHHASLWFFLLAASLPVLGWGIRTYRSAHEFARSASLFHAKRHNLEDLKKEIEQVDFANPNTLRHLLWKGEDYLEREHREWLWLMIEAEWY